MVAHVHFILNHTQVGLFIQIIGEGDIVLLCKRHHWYPMADGVEVAHVSDKSIPLIEGNLAVDDRLGGIKTQDRRG